MRLTVCQLPNDRADFAAAWATLRDYVGAQRTDVVLLPEMIASTWFPAHPTFDAGVWQQALEAHVRWEDRLSDLGVPSVIGARPAATATGRHIEVMHWRAESGAGPVHYKRYMPDEPGWHEATWFQQPPPSFEPFQCQEARVGALSCTEIWFQEWARRYGHAGAHLIVNPRATGPGSVENWLLAGRAAALVAGCYVASSNRSDLPGRTPVAGQPAFGGIGWVIGPDGKVLATTSNEHPFVTVDIALEMAQAAKLNYPCCVPE